MKDFRYILLFSFVLLAVACTKNEFDTQKGKNNSVQFIGRVMPFTGCDVNTRAGKTYDESSVYSMCLATFDTNNQCKDVRYSDGSNISFTLSRNNLDNGYKIYAFTNIPNPNFTTDNDLDDFLQLASEVQGIDIPTLNVNGKEYRCIPMVGVYTIENKDNLPPIVSIPLEALYAKFVFTINVDPDQKVEGIDPASFTLEGFEVHNLATTVDFVGGTSASTTDNVSVFTDAVEGVINSSANTMAQGSRTVSFSFYLPERYLSPETQADNFTYPFGKIADLDDDEKERYPQRYKPLLVNGKNATFVRFNGEFIDHQQHNYKVSYDIYVGKDNYGNFDVERNTQYNNYITIRGVTTSKNETESDQTISIDHRVNVTRVNPLIVNLRRETLLDSHFEVRPLRIGMNPDYSGISLDKERTFTVEVEYPGDESNWIGLEQSFGGDDTHSTSDTYLVQSELTEERQNAAGKRKYFTTNLLQSLPDKIEDIRVSNNQCIWIYVDEANPSKASDAVRSAKIIITYYEDGIQYGEPIEYTINQRQLFPVKYGNNEYLIEYHEEYLHNYDVEDSFGQTEYDGMKWGLPNLQLSFILDAILISKGTWSDADTDIKNALKSYTPKYDFYLPRDITKDDWTWENDEAYDNLVHKYNGYEFCKNIISEVNSNNHSDNTDDDIKKLHLSQDPKSAIEYCFNKNKRNENGEVIDVVWYLPAIDEIEEIVMSQCSENFNQYSYSRFPDFRAKQYWSCQPAYYNNYIFVEREYLGTAGDRHGRYMKDDVSRARATSVTYSNKTGNGPTDPNNYDKSPSGSNGYTKYIDADYTYKYWVTGGEISNTEEHDVEGAINFKGSNQKDSWDHTLYVSQPEASNLHRVNDMARVRCVRKVQ